MAFAEPHPGLCCPLPSPWDTGWHGGGFPNRLLEVSLLSRASQGSPMLWNPSVGFSLPSKPTCNGTSVVVSGLSTAILVSLSFLCLRLLPCSGPLSPPMRRPSPLPKEPFPLSWIHFFSAQPTCGKCQAGSCLAFIWLWPGPLLSLRVCSLKSHGYHTPANKPPKPQTRTALPGSDTLRPTCFPSQRLGSCSLIFFFLRRGIM